MIWETERDHSQTESEGSVFTKFKIIIGIRETKFKK